MSSVRLVSPTGTLGLEPLDEEAFSQAMVTNPDFVGVDAGSLDPGPFYLGAGLPHSARFQTKREYYLYMKATRTRRIPLVIGTAGGNGGRRHIQHDLAIIREVAAELGERFRVALIDTTLDQQWLQERAAREEIPGYKHDRSLTPEDVAACTEVVAQIGIEPFIRALRDYSPDIVLAGRSCDDAIFAALPVMLGMPRGLAHHLGKVVECGGLCLDPSEGFKSVVGTIYNDYFVVEPGDPNMRCSVTSVAAHSVYERTDPTNQGGPGGFLDMQGCSIEPFGERGVRISGSRWVPVGSYAVKLEGAEKMGYRSIFIGGARDPGMIAQIDTIIRQARERLAADMATKGLLLGREFHVTFRVYGRNGVMGPREIHQGPSAHELCIVLDIVADSQQLAEDICYYGKNFLVWCNYDGRLTTAGNLAYPYSPSVHNLGEVYRLRVHHLLPIDDPEMFPIQVVEAG